MLFWALCSFTHLLMYLIDSLKREFNGHQRIVKDVFHRLSTSFSELFPQVFHRAFDHQNDNPIIKMTTGSIIKMTTEKSSK